MIALLIIKTPYLKKTADSTLKTKIDSWVVIGPDVNIGGIGKRIDEQTDPEFAKETLQFGGQGIGSRVVC